MKKDFSACSENKSENFSACGSELGSGGGQEAGSPIKKLLAFIQVRDENGLNHSDNCGCGEKKTDAGYIMKAEYTVFVGRLDM